MSDPLVEEDDASTPLTEEERAELIPSYITLRSELNEAEQRNILGSRRMGLLAQAGCPVRTLFEGFTQTDVWPGVAQGREISADRTQYWRRGLLYRH